MKEKKVTLEQSRRNALYTIELLIDNLALTTQADKEKWATIMYHAIEAKTGVKR